MPRDSSGIYSLPSGYLGTTGETILASQHNSPLEDIRDALTNSLPRNGAAPMTAALKMGANKITGLADGTAATDAAAFGQLGYLKHIPEVIKTDDYTITTAEAGKAVIANKATAITFTLPAVASADEPYLIRNIGAGDLTVDGDSSEEIEGATTLVLKTGDAALIWANGTLWRAFRSIRQQTTTDNTIPRFDGTDGALQTTGIVIADTSNDMSGVGQISTTATGANTVPSGTTAQRPTAAEAKIRYNSDLNTIEAYDGTGWRLLNRPLLHLQYKVAEGTNGQSFSSGVNTVSLNTEVTDEIGSTLSSNTFTLPAGTYEVDARILARGGDVYGLDLYNVTDTALAVTGLNVLSSTSDESTLATCRGRFTIAAQKTFRMEVSISDTVSSAGPDVDRTGRSEIYHDVWIERIY